jgi:hypothetical protein
MDTRPPPYNPYMYSTPLGLPQPNNLIATAPPMDDDAPIRYPPPIQQHYVYPYPPAPFNYLQNVEQYRRDEIERRRQQDNDCCCFAILATLCCCFVNTEIQ